MTDAHFKVLRMAHNRACQTLVIAPVSAVPFKGSEAMAPARQLLNGRVRP